MSAKDLLIQLFNLPKGEIIFQDYSCALKGLFSKYGRIFLAENNICFYANLGGSKTKLVIKLDDVQAIEKKSKSDIEVSLKDNHVYCFNSFADREQVYSLMNALLTGQPVNLEAKEQPVSGENSDLQEEGAILENADVEVSFLAADGKKGEAEQEMCKLTFQFNADKFFDLFLGEEALYSYVDHRKSQQDTDTILSKWQPLEDNYGSFQRELKTVIKLVGVPFKDKSRMHKLQTYKKEEGKLTFYSTTHTLDVPYANCFQFEERWEVMNTDDGKCVLRCFGWVVFTKSTIMKSTIVPRTLQGVKEDYEKWAANVKARLEQLAKPAVKAQPNGMQNHEYEDSKNLDDYNILNKLSSKNQNKKKSVEIPVRNVMGNKSELVFLGTLVLLIIIMVFQLLVMSAQSRKLDHLEQLIISHRAQL